MTEASILKDAERVCERVDFGRVKGAKVLLTGASGLVGSHMLACLRLARERGAACEVYAQALSEPPPHTQALLAAPGFHLTRANLARHEDCLALPEADVIIHAAGYGQPGMFMLNPAATIELNTTATALLLQKLRPGGSFLFVSTSEVYSGLRKALITEDDIGVTTPLHPRASYIEGKRCGEAICNAYRSKGVRAVSARLALAYGPGTRKHDKRALNAFIERGLCEPCIELLDAGAALRTYCYVADAVELLWHALLRGTQPVYNVGGHSTVTIAELARMIGRLTGKEVKFPATASELAGAPEEVRMDLSRAETEFKKTDYIGIEEGLRRTVEWQRALYAAS